MHFIILIGVLLLILAILRSDDSGGGFIVPLAIIFILPWLVMIGIGLFGMASNP